MKSRHVLRKDHRHQIIAHVDHVPALPKNCEILHAVLKAENPEQPIQWLVAKTQRAWYVAFRGSYDLQDLVIDIGCTPNYETKAFADLGLGVHSGMDSIMQQRGGSNTLDAVIEVLKRKAAECGSRPGVQETFKLVLCGHSLGGGYAQLAAMHIERRMQCKELMIPFEIVGIRTFGSPQVVAPPHNKELLPLWQRLNAIARPWVHAWDPVPRILGNQSWLTEVLLKLTKRVGPGVSIGADTLKRYTGLELNFTQVSRHLTEYDVLGEIVMVSMGNDLVHAKSRCQTRTPNELLDQKPPDALFDVDKLTAYHSMVHYHYIAEEVARAHCLSYR
eukprot:4282018-Amphidinium_carterae.1